MEDIKKAIEEEARYSLMKKAGVDMNEFKNHHELVLTKNDVLRVANDCANFILSKWEDSERWRKVEEELPACEDDLVIVKVRNKNKEDGIFLYDICYIDEETNTWGKRHHTWEDIIEWKPIH